ncbi:MAG: ABC transporter substrate-binding protein, partial [Gemmatimonadaceae bacterium]|nr:ABC transporter substrate-binding protein [Gemmatimonadaceae bacterium]
MAVTSATKIVLDPLGRRGVALFISDTGIVVGTVRRARTQLRWWSALTCILTANAALAQGSVSGRVTMLERPGETTTDIANTVIYLLPKGQSRVATKEQRTQVAMNGRQFQPRVRVVTPGTKIGFPNQDPFSHNIFSSAADATFDLGLYGTGGSKDAQFKKPGAYPVYCNIHARMSAYIIVAPTPWTAQAGNDGRWTIERVPAGSYEATVWHERAGAPVTLDYVLHDTAGEWRIINVIAEGVSDLALRSTQY